MCVPTFESIEEANEWGMSIYPHMLWRLGGLDHSLIQPVVEQFHSLAQQFPTVAAMLTSYNVSEVIDEDPDKPAFAYYDRKDRSIHLNYRDWQDADVLRDKASYNLWSRFRLLAVDDVAYFITHEFGHAVYDMFIGSDEYKEWKALPREALVSKCAYADENHRFTETFAAYLLMENRSPYVKRTYELAYAVIGSS